MENFIVAGIVLVLAGAAVYYLWKERKKGARCIGCPSAGTCPCKECDIFCEKEWTNPESYNKIEP